MTTSDSCLDAETLAAWVDGGLSGAELRIAQSHVADCARCRSLVGAMARTSAAVPQLEPPRATRRWLAWAVPLAAAATAVVIWTIVPRNASEPPAVATQLARAAQPTPEQPEVVVSPEVIPEKEEPTREAKVAAPAAPQPAERRDQLAAGSAVSPAQEASRQAFSKDVAGAPAAASAARALSENIATAAPRVQDFCGANWTGPAPAVTTPLTAGSSPAANTCWVVGRLGVVLLTTDGRTWRGITFPVITDLSSVTATDARNATVVTADGRSFTTTDGGTTWR